jgi:hypothetical protein
MKPWDIIGWLVVGVVLFECARVFVRAALGIARQVRSRRTAVAAGQRWVWGTDPDSRYSFEILKVDGGRVWVRSSAGGEWSLPVEEWRRLALERNYLLEDRG